MDQVRESWLSHSNSYHHLRLGHGHAKSAGLIDIYFPIILLVFNIFNLNLINKLLIN